MPLTPEEQDEVSIERLDAINIAQENYDKANKSEYLGPNHALTGEAKRQHEKAAYFKEGKYAYPIGVLAVGIFLTLAVLAATGPLAPMFFIMIGLTLLATYAAKKFADWKNELKLKGGKKFAEEKFASALPWLVGIGLTLATGLPGLIMLGILVLHKLRITKPFEWMFSKIVPESIKTMVGQKWKGYSALKKAVILSVVLASLCAFPIMLPASLGMMGISMPALLPSIGGLQIFAALGSGLSGLAQLAASAMSGSALGAGLATIFSSVGSLLTGGMAIPFMVGMVGATAASVMLAMTGWGLLAMVAGYLAYKAYKHFSNAKYNDPKVLEAAIDAEISAKNGSAPQNLARQTNNQTPGQTPTPGNNNQNNTQPAPGPLNAPNTPPPQQHANLQQQQPGYAPQQPMVPYPAPQPMMPYPYAQPPAYYPPPAYAPVPVQQPVYAVPAGFTPPPAYAPGYYAPQSTYGTPPLGPGQQPIVQQPAQPVQTQTTQPIQPQPQYYQPSAPYQGSITQQQQPAFYVQGQQQQGHAGFNPGYTPPTQGTPAFMQQVQQVQQNPQPGAVIQPLAPNATQPLVTTP